MKNLMRKGFLQVVFIALVFCALNAQAETAMIEGTIDARGVVLETADGTIEIKPGGPPP